MGRTSSGDQEGDRDSGGTGGSGQAAADPAGVQGVVAPLVTDINLSLDDRFLYVSCWGTGEFIQYDVSDPFNPKKVSSIQLGGIVRRAAHPSKPQVGR